MSNELNELKALQIHMKKRIDVLEKELTELRNLPEEEKICVSTDSPDNVYAAFTDRHRADLDCDESGVTWCAVTLYRGPRKV